jgi:hypothetical protein
MIKKSSESKWSMVHNSKLAMKMQVKTISIRNVVVTQRVVNERFFDGRAISPFLSLFKALNNVAFL